MGIVFGRVGIALIAALASAPPTFADPSAGSAADRCGATVRLRGPIYDYATGALQPGVGALLDQLAAVFMERCRDKLLIIEAHAMELPTADLNQRLSELRALTIRFELAQRGVPETQLLPLGMGNSKPEVPATDPDALSLNRRVTFRVAD